MIISNGMHSFPRTTYVVERHRLAKRTYHYLLSIFIYLLVLGLIHLPLNTYSLMISESPWTMAHYRRIYIVVSSLILLCLYGFGLCVLDQRSRTGLIVFAWLVTLLDVVATIAVLILLFLTIILKPISLISLETFMGALVFLCLATATLVIIVISVKHAFYLTKLIKNSKEMMIEYI